MYNVKFVVVIRAGRPIDNSGHIFEFVDVDSIWSFDSLQEAKNKISEMAFPILDSDAISYCWVDVREVESK